MYFCTLVFNERNVIIFLVISRYFVLLSIKHIGGNKRSSPTTHKQEYRAPQNTTNNPPSTTRSVASRRAAAVIRRHLRGVGGVQNKQHWTQTNKSLRLVLKKREFHLTQRLKSARRDATAKALRSDACVQTNTNSMHQSNRSNYNTLS